MAGTLPQELWRTASEDSAVQGVRRAVVNLKDDPDLGKKYEDLVPLPQPAPQPAPQPPPRPRMLPASLVGHVTPGSSSRRTSSRLKNNNIFEGRLKESLLGGVATSSGGQHVLAANSTEDAKREMLGSLQKAKAPPETDIATDSNGTSSTAMVQLPSGWRLFLCNIRLNTVSVDLGQMSVQITITQRRPGEDYKMAAKVELQAGAAQAVGEGLSCCAVNWLHRAFVATASPVWPDSEKP